MEITINIENPENVLDAVLTKEFQQEVIKKATEKIGGETLTQLAAEASKKIEAIIERRVKKRISSFLKEDVALTNKRGKTYFVGSIEDLIKNNSTSWYWHPWITTGKSYKGVRVARLKRG